MNNPNLTDKPDAQTPCVQRMVSLHGWKFTAFKSTDQTFEEYQGGGRKNGELLIVTRSWHDTKKAAMQAARDIAIEMQANDQAQRPEASNKKP